MPFLPLAAVFIFCLTLLSACGQDDAAVAPPPAALTRDAVGYYCSMTVADHPGPKGQIHLKDTAEPLWFSSARDAVAFTMLPGESKRIAAIYVHDAGRMNDWKKPGDDAWIEARSAVYVIGSRMKGGMGQAETVPFAEPAKAASFSAKNGGKVVTWSEIPTDYVIDTGTAHAGS